jgi:hypothetical protein
VEAGEVVPRSEESAQPALQLYARDDGFEEPATARPCGLRKGKHGRDHRDGRVPHHRGVGVVVVESVPGGAVHERGRRRRCAPAATEERRFRGMLSRRNLGDEDVDERIAGPRKRAAAHIEETLRGDPSGIVWNVVVTERSDCRNERRRRHARFSGRRLTVVRPRGAK